MHINERTIQVENHCLYLRNRRLRHIFFTTSKEALLLAGVRSSDVVVKVTAPPKPLFAVPSRDRVCVRAECGARFGAVQAVLHVVPWIVALRW